MPEKKKGTVKKTKPKKNLPAKIDSLQFNPQTIIEMAVTQKVPMDILKELLAMRKEWQKEQAEIAFREAMSKFQAQCPIINKSVNVDYTSKKGWTGRSRR